MSSTSFYSGTGVTSNQSSSIESSVSAAQTSKDAAASSATAAGLSATAAANSATTANTAATSTNVSTVASNIAAINSVANNVSSLGLVAGDIGYVIAAATNASNINTVAADGTDIGLVAGSIANVNLTGGSIGNVNTVAGISGNVTGVAAIAGDITTVAGKATEIGLLTAAPVLYDMSLLAVPDVITDMALLAAPGIIDDITSVADIKANVTSVAGIVSHVPTVAGMYTNVNTVAGQENQIALLGTVDAVADMNALAVASVLTDMDALADITGHIQSVSGISANVTTVAGISSAVTAVGAFASDLPNVISNETAIVNVSDNISAVNNVSTNMASVTDAVASAATATTQAGIATTKAGEAATSETNAATSETNAATSETNADTSEANALTYSSNAATSAAAAASSAAGIAGYDLDVIAETKGDTAVDVFVYDTSKDSDGGAWRKRTQSTSWYNETLNTATRGSRKEFPAVAVIVAESNQVTIYDGDDPDMPMWMVFTWTSIYNMLGYGNRAKNSVSMLNGGLFTGAVTDGVFSVNFITDQGVRYTNIGSYYTGNAIVNRNVSSSNAYPIISSALAIVSLAANDVAMTVLPNAPIDAATGLPVPTIAVATDGGVSVIKDDGTVVDSVSTQGAAWVLFDNDFGIWFNRDTATYVLRYASLEDYISGDGFGGSLAASIADFYPSFDLLVRGNSAGSFSRNNLALAGTGTTGDTVAGLMLHQPNYTDQSKGMSALLTSTYNTGWMNGDIKLATLSDTDDTDVTGSDLVVNGDFATSSDWTIDGDSTGWSITGGVLQGSSATGNVLQDITTVVGEKYVISFEISGHSGTGDVYVRPGIDAGTGDYVDEDGLYSGGFTATSTTTTLVIRGRPSQPFSGNIDNVSVRLAEEDRSVNGNGLQVFGSITKDPVASGADLVAYSGFTSSNYLQQPYNSDLDFGTGDFCVMLWVNVNSGFSATDYIFSRGTHLGYALNASGSEYNFYADGTAIDVSGLQTGVWQFICCGVRGGQRFISLNAGEEQTSAISTSVDEADATLIIGNYSAGSSAFFNGIVSLFRISATAPSPEQIARIYNDEKHLFTEGAQATLYGSSDAVTALAHDDATNLLHVGTSAGRSVFQGLRRVENTTTAVGAAISAANNMIVEE